MSSYIICATPRSGSTLLCDLLAETGVAGRPNSYYRRQNIANWARDWGVLFSEHGGRPAFERAYLGAVLRAGKTRTAVFGLRLMWGTLGELCARLGVLFPGLANDAALLDQAFGTPAYIHLSRSDKISQAISLLRAEQSGLWHRAADGSERERVAPPAPEVYDAHRLGGFVEELARDDAAWNAWFARHAIAPLRLSYEDLARDPRQALASVLEGLGLDRTLATTVETQTAKLADTTSRDWAARFRRERVRPNR